MTSLDRSHHATTMCIVGKIVSGAQTGVDRAALDAAIEAGVPHGGWVPRGRRAEDGAVPPRYQVRETDSTDYPLRTELNVRDSDGTLIITRGRFDGGTALTARLAKGYRRPLCIARSPEETPAMVREWIRKNRIHVLNVAGPRESKAPGIYDIARAFVHAVLSGE